VRNSFPTQWKGQAGVIRERQVNFNPSARPSTERSRQQEAFLQHIGHTGLLFRETVPAQIRDY